VLLGVWARIVRPLRGGEVEGKWAAAFSLGLSCFLFHCVVSSGLEPRYLLSAVPVMIMFLVAGVAYAAALLPLAKLSTTHKMGVLAAALAVIFWVGVFRVPRKYSYGFQNVAEDLLARPEFKDSVILVSSEREGEGALVSELAMHEHPRPRHVILRGSKVLADSDWMGFSYKLRFNTEDEIERYLEQIPVGVLVLEISPPKYRYAHHEMLRKVVQAHSDRWKLVKAYERKPPDLPFPMKILVYSQEGHQSMAKGTIEIELKSLSRTIRKSLAEPDSSR
jgi:hypothetical protein